MIGGFIPEIMRNTNNEAPILFYCSVQYISSGEVM